MFLPKYAQTRLHFTQIHLHAGPDIQVLTGEDWNAVMYDGMAATSEWQGLTLVHFSAQGKHTWWDTPGA
jgi:hypothetical protein